MQYRNTHISILKTEKIKPFHYQICHDHCGTAIYIVYINKGTYKRYKDIRGNVKPSSAVILHLIDVGVPHLGEEPEGRWGVRVVYRELDPSLGHKTDIYMQFTIYMIVVDGGVK